MEIDQIQTFATLAKTKSFTRTAEVLHLVQPTVSTRIRLLEASIGRPLFIRGNRRVELTPAGEIFLPYAERILALAQESKIQIQSRGHFDDRIVIGSTDSLWRTVLLPLLIEFADRFPRIALITETGHSADIVEKLLDGVVQIGFIYTRPTHPSLQCLRFLEGEIALVTGAGSPFAKLPVVHRADCANLPLLSIPWDGEMQRWMDSVLPANAIPPIYPDQLNILVSLLIHGNGAAFVPRYTVEKELKAGSLVAIKMGKDLKAPRRAAHLVFKKDTRSLAAIENWKELLQNRGFKLKAR